jgi:mono/diheme cytochrome c family protein
MIALFTISLAHSVWITRAGLLTVLTASVGCNPTNFEYRPNSLHAASLLRESGDESASDTADPAANVVAAWFGTVDEPRWPTELVSSLVGADTVVEMVGVMRSAGAVGRGDDKIERGLFRKHCVTCHGISGDGRGPAALLLSPYPRDFRRGTFKFKSTPAGTKPTRDDLYQTLHDGIPGTAMPSFAALERSKEFAEDITALAEYIRFLAIRGEVERKLITKNVKEGLRLDATDEEARDVLRQVVSQWIASVEKVVSVPEAPDLSDQEMLASVERGREWFRSEMTACAKCHGLDGAGNGTSQDYDEWTKDWTILAGIDPKDKKAWKEMKPYGAMKPVIDSPRNLTSGTFRGGKDREDLFRRLVLGIEGTPMPPIARADGSNSGLTDDQIWDVVHYVLSIGNTSKGGLR